MTRQLLAIAFAATAAGGVAWADKPVHASATVEVLDDKSQIDDVISRMRDQQQKQKDEAKKGSDKDKAAGSLRQDRPSSSLSSAETHRPLAPEAKSQPPGSRRPLREEHNFERAERPRPKHK
jgi:hypothetical protein